MQSMWIDLEGKMTGMIDVLMVKLWLEYWKHQAMKGTPLKEIKTFYEWMSI